MSLFRCLFIAGFIRASRIKLAQSRSSSVYSLRYLLPKRRLCLNAVAELSEINLRSESILIHKTAAARAAVLPVVYAA